MERAARSQKLKLWSKSRGRGGAPACSLRALRETALKNIDLQQFQQPTYTVDVYASTYYTRAPLVRVTLGSQGDHPEGEETQSPRHEGEADNGVVYHAALEHVELNLR